MSYLVTFTPGVVCNRNNSAIVSSVQQGTIDATYANDEGKQVVARKATIHNRLGLQSLLINNAIVIGPMSSKVIPLNNISSGSATADITWQVVGPPQDTLFAAVLPQQFSAQRTCFAIFDDDTTSTEPLYVASLVPQVRQAGGIGNFAWAGGAYYDFSGAPDGTLPPSYDPTILAMGVRMECRSGSDLLQYQAVYNQYVPGNTAGGGFFNGTAIFSGIISAGGVVEIDLNGAMAFGGHEFGTVSGQIDYTTYVVRV